MAELGKLYHTVIIISIPGNKWQNLHSYINFDFGYLYINIDLSSMG